MNKEMQQLIRRLRAQGFHVRLGRSGHYRATAPGGATVSLPATPSGGKRSIPNTRAKLRRIGARI